MVLPKYGLNLWYLLVVAGGTLKFAQMHYQVLFPSLSHFLHAAYVLFFSKCFRDGFLPIKN